MKRLVLFFMAAILSLASQAQPNIEGKWKLTETEKQKIGEKDEGGIADIKTTLTYTFAGGRFECTIEAVTDMSFAVKDDQAANSDIVVLLDITASSGGSYTLESDLLTLVPDKKKKPKVDVDANITGIAGGSMIKNMLAAPLKKALVAKLKEVQQYKVLSVTDKSLTLLKVVSGKDNTEKAKVEPITLTK